MPKISLIIPVYNVEKYLRQCLDSAVNQTLNDIEMIIINDGSTDSSLSIIQEYAKKDSRIIVIDKANGGPSLARNIAIDKAKGDYIAFLDSDDWIKPDMLEKMNEKAISTGSEIVICNCYNYYETTGQFEEKYNFNKLVSEIKNNPIFQIDDRKKVVNIISPCIKIYEKNFYLNNGLKFPIGLHFEDNPVNYKACVFANKIFILNEALMYYRQRENSITKRKDRIRFDIFEIFKLINTFLSDNNLEEYKESLKYRQLSDGFTHLNNIHNDYLKEFFCKFGDLLSDYSSNDLKLLGKIVYLEFLLIKHKLFFIWKLFSPIIRAINNLYKSCKSL